MHRSFGLDGGGSVTADRAGNVYIAWHGIATDEKSGAGVQGEARRQVWITKSADDGRTFPDEQPAWKQTRSPSPTRATPGAALNPDAFGHFWTVLRGFVADASENRRTPGARQVNPRPGYPFRTLYGFFMSVSGTAGLRNSAVARLQAAAALNRSSSGDQQHASVSPLAGQCACTPLASWLPAEATYGFSYVQIGCDSMIAASAWRLW
jgi:hypothetical protein